MRVLVFPSSNEPGLEVIEALRRHPRIEVYGGSSFDILSDPSRILLDKKHSYLPALDAVDFKEKIVDHCKKNDIDIVFPTVDSVVAEMSNWNESFKVIAPSNKLAKITLSKSQVYKAVEDVVPVPRVFDETNMDFPAFAKPDMGSGSRGVMRISNIEELRSARESGLLTQEFLPGREFTVDCVGDSEGNLISFNVRQRLAYQAGIAKAATCVDNPEIERYIAEIALKLPFSGPWFAQFREDANGVPRLMEINARIGGSSGITRLSGINIPLLSVLCATKIPVVAVKKMDVGTLVRRLDLNGDIDDFDWVIWDLDDTLVHAGEKVDPEMVGWLYRFNQRGKTQSLVTRNIDPDAMIGRTKLPNFFDCIIKTKDKIDSVGKLISERKVSRERIIMINDSGAEKVDFFLKFPEIRTITPDGINVLKKNSL